MPPRRAGRTATSDLGAPAGAAAAIDPAVAVLGLRDSLFLLSVLTDAADVPAFRNAKARSRLAPHAEMASQMLRELAEAGAISWGSAGNAPKSWIFGATTSLAMEWRLSDALAAVEDLTSQLKRHAASLSSTPAATEDLFTVWRELAISEAVGFLGDELGEHRFDENWALAAVPAIERGLRRLSANQMYYFCWLAVRELASRYLRYPASIHTLADSLVLYIDQRVDRAIAERWALRDWSDYRGRVPSTVAAVFADQITELGSDYLARVPSRELLSQRQTGARGPVRAAARSNRRLSPRGAL